MEIDAEKNFGVIYRYILYSVCLFDSSGFL